MDLFSFAYEEKDTGKMKPLAARMRPKSVDELIGQQHIIAPGKLLRRAIEADHLSSLIFYGPPGTGKTTMAKVIANSTKSHFVELNAVTAGVADIRKVVEEARDRLIMSSQRTTLFVDEIHRFNKSQQDALLPFVEEGTIILIGATTENPFFEVNAALLSRSQIFSLHSLTEEELGEVMHRALTDFENGLGELDVKVTPEAREHLIRYAEGDARRLLNALEIAATTTPLSADGSIVVTLDVAVESIQRRAVRYDKNGDNHYDTISAFIKSIRGSDPDAALYWLARMIDAGEDHRFIARRLVISASEDIGNA
ncbi:MAG: replication-associated recombination protein A, partial [Clostridia bacterium]